MSRRPPREVRFLGLWTAGWLAVLLVAGLLVAGDIRLQWPVLAVPLLWALVALRPRRRRATAGDDHGDAPGFWGGEHDHDDGSSRHGEPWDDGDRDDGDWADGGQDGGWPPAGRRADPPIRDWQPPPPTRETQVLPPLPPRHDPREY